jgi:transcriptional regulator with XRE-family HTH domain
VATVTDVAGDESTGARIAQARKLRDLTQRALAGRAHVSYSTLTKVESGHAVATPAFLAAVARALRVDVTQLTGQPYLAELRADGLEPLVEPLRATFDAYDLGASAGVEPRAVDVVEADVADCCDQVMIVGHVGDVAARLPGLLDELAALVERDNGDRRVWRTLALAYRAGQHVASKWGYRDLASVALDRMAWAAEQAQDPLVEALRYHERAHEHLRAGHYDRGLVLLERARSTAEQAPAGVERTTVIGQSHLATSIHAARSGDSTATDDHLAQAGELAQTTGEVLHLYGLSFGPTNALLHRVASLVERDRHDEALAVASAVSLPAGWPPTRSAHHCIDLARAHLALGQPERALEHLNRARERAPQVTRYHPTVRQTVEHLVASRRRLPPGLGRYARWLGL